MKNIPSIKLSVQHLETAGYTTLLHFVVLALYYLLGFDEEQSSTVAAWCFRLLAAGLLAYPLIVLYHLLHQLGSWTGSASVFILLALGTALVVLMTDTNLFSPNIKLGLNLALGILYCYVVVRIFTTGFAPIAKATALQCYLFVAGVYGATQILYSLAGPSRADSAAADWVFGMVEAVLYFTQIWIFLHLAKYYTRNRPPWAQPVTATP